MPTDPHIHNPDGIIEDEISLANKGKVMERLKNKNMYDAVSKIAMFAGTLLMTATAGGVLGGLFQGAALATVLSAPAVTALAVGALIIGVAVATDYISSGIGQGASYDIQEATAHSAARQMRQEFEQANLVVLQAPNAQNAAAQKNWAMAEDEKLRQIPEMAQQR